jgi:hypothetical protein
MTRDYDVLGCNISERPVISRRSSVIGLQLSVLSTRTEH